jgi:hypothetical protein
MSFPDCKTKYFSTTPFREAPPLRIMPDLGCRLDGSGR